MPLLWKFVFEGSTNFNTTGYKVAAYTNLFSWSPYALFVVVYWATSRAAILHQFLESSLTLSILGPWLFNFYSIYAIGKTGLTNSSSAQILGLVGYIIYSGLMMLIQYRLAPTVLQVSYEDLAPETNFYRDYQEPKPDRKPAPEMEEDDYLAETEASGGAWPTYNEQEDIYRSMQANIENDPRPSTARDYSLPFFTV